MMTQMMTLYMLVQRRHHQPGQGFLLSPTLTFTVAANKCSSLFEDMGSETEEYFKGTCVDDMNKALVKHFKKTELNSHSEDLLAHLGSNNAQKMPSLGE